MKKIKIQNSEQFFYIDKKDFIELKNYKFYISKNGYVRFTINKKRIFVHRYITKCPNDKVVDHINGNKLDNTRTNLRICSQSENSKNRSSKSGTSKYKGVSFCSTEKRKKKWKAAIETHNKHICIGRFYTEKEAAIAYNKKAVELFGEYAKINKIKD